MALDFPNFDPVALQIGPLAIRWYALAYMAGFLGGWKYGRWLTRPGGRPDKTDIDDFIPWAIGGVILGGRIGYVLFYNSAQYMDAPLEIFKIWRGGMAFHGGALGVIIALIIFARIRKIPLLGLSDIVCAAVPIGLFFGRLANFVNGELFGRAADVWWAVKFPAGGGIPRHPSQIYEAFLEGAVLFCVLFLLARNEKIRARPGIVTGVFLAGYALCRMSAEFFREPDAQIGFLWAGATMGQVLSVPMLALGAGVVVYALNTNRR